MKINLKSQSAIEFVVLASFMLFVILGFFAITTSNMIQAREDSNRKTAEDIAGFVYREVEIAKSVNSGYLRIFSVPYSVNGIDYSINLTDNRELTVNYLGYEHVMFLPANITGNVTKGSNIITNSNGIIFLNPH